MITQVERWMVNGVSIIKDAKELSPGKSMTVLFHGEPFALPPTIKRTAIKRRDGPLPRELRHAADSEVARTRDLRYRKLQCCEEVRDMWEPPSATLELPKPAAPSESMISGGYYGGNLPHLQMSLPFLYPINAKGFGAHDAGRKGIEAMDSLDKGVRGKHSRVGQFHDQRLNVNRRAQVLALSRLAELRGATQRVECSKRRDARVILPGFEDAGLNLSTAAHVRASAVLTAGLPFHPLPDRMGWEKLCQLRLSAKAGSAVVRGATFSLQQPLNGTKRPLRRMHRSGAMQEGARKSQGGQIDIKKGKPQLRRRNSFPILPSFASRPYSNLAALKEENRLVTLARVSGGCLRTFWAREGDFHSHHHTVNQVAWSLDEKRVSSCSNDKTVRLWAPQTGQCVRTLVGHEDAVMGCAFSEDGLRLVSCGMDNFLILWNTVNGEMLRRFFGHDDVVYRCILFRNSSAMLSCSSDRTLKSWFLTPQPPDPPDQPLISDAGQRAAHVTWRAPPAYNDDIVAYKIQLRVGLRVAFGHETTVDGATFKKQVDGLKPGQNYQFRICAVNRMGQGDWSEPSAQHVTRVGVPEPLEQPVVIRSWFRPRRIVFCWHAPLATRATL